MPAESAEENTETSESRQSEELINARPDLEEAKLRFLKAAEEISPLGIVKRRPLASMGVAFLAGFGLSRLGGSKAAPPALETMAQIAGIAAQFVPLFIARARSSDG